MTGEYNFNKNLLKVSRATNIQDAKKEFVIIGKSAVDPKKQCICTRKIKILIFLYNIVTKCTIIVGTGCCKNFITGLKKANDNYYTHLLYEYIENGQYDVINDIVVYCNDVKATLIERYENEFTKYKASSNIAKLSQLKIDLDELDSKYSITYLNYLICLIEQAITEIRKKNEEEARKLYEEAAAKARVQEVREREQCERERLQREAEVRLEEAEYKLAVEKRAKFEAKQQEKLEREKEIKEINEQKQKRREERVSSLSTLVCVNCSKEFKDSPCRNTKCCCLKCEWEYYT